MPSKHLIPQKKSLNSLFILFIIILPALWSAALLMLDLKKIDVFELASFPSTLSALVCLVLFALQLGPLNAYTVWQSDILFLCVSPITSQIIMSMSSNLISGIPSSSGLLPGATKNLHLAVLSLYLNLTVHTSSDQYLTNHMFLV